MTCAPVNNSRPRRGIFLADTIIGFTLIAILSLMLVVAITRSNRARERLAGATDSTRTARRVMTLLQQGQAAPQNLDGAEVRVAPAPGGAEVPGHTWVAVTVSREGRPFTLVGLVPRKEAR
jgi:hypothetical protein